MAPEKTFSTTQASHDFQVLPTNFRLGTVLLFCSLESTKGSWNCFWEISHKQKASKIRNVIKWKLTFSQKSFCYHLFDCFRHCRQSRLKSPWLATWKINRRRSRSVSKLCKLFLFDWSSRQKLKSFNDSKLFGNFQGLSRIFENIYFMIDVRNGRLYSCDSKDIIYQYDRVEIRMKIISLDAELNTACNSIAASAIQGYLNRQQ